jgi:hydrogenase nickel incorporation protein HypA/HybF
MHELSIATSLVELACDEAERLALPVVALHVTLGPLSGVVREALKSAYEVARNGTPLAGATLIIRDVPIVAWCPVCGSEQTVESPQRLRCPVCDTPTPDVRSGRELELVALEITDANPPGRSPAEGPQAE